MGRGVQVKVAASNNNSHSCLARVGVVVSTDLLWNSIFEFVRDGGAGAWLHIGPTWAFVSSRPEASHFWLA